MVERCNKTIVRDYGWKLSCSHLRGHCPLHDRKPYGPQKAGASRSLSLGGAPAAVPMLPLFDSAESAA